jgi:hypothetical protein
MPLLGSVWTLIIDCIGYVDDFESVCYLFAM